MRSGGWTLVGQIGHVVANIYDKWLVTNQNTGILRSPIIEEGTYGCIDAVDMAVYHANKIRFSSGENNTGMGRFWVEWDLPANRSVDTFWRHSLGFAIIDSATVHPVEVRSSFRRRHTCYNTKYGILPIRYDGGGFPGTSHVPSGGAMQSHDLCMIVGVMGSGNSANGFTQNQPYYSDVPTSNSDWPNRSFTIPPFISVWMS